MIFSAVLMAGIGTTLFLWGRVSDKTGLKGEGARMRELYVGLSLYESDSDGTFPPDLSRISLFLSSPTLLTSSADPFRNETAPFPLDGSLPDSPKEAQTRVSDAYLYSHVAAGKIQAPPWAETKFDPTLGVLASEWMGSVKPREAFRAEVSGRLLRVNTDGSLVTVSGGGPRELGDAQTLFRRPPQGVP